VSHALRTWDRGPDRLPGCAECCHGDRCDDSSHYARSQCPHCNGTGDAIWLDAAQGAVQEPKP
jgi:hypothetical protein